MAWRARLAGALLAFTATSAFAQPEIPALPEIDDALAATNPALVKKRGALIADRKKLIERTNRHNDKCSAVIEGSAADAPCTKAYAELKAAIDQHVEASKRYNADHAAATRLAATRRAAPHADASVVDARNVPSGLPQSVQDAIAGAYAESPPGVSERVRKGFHAVMERDWKAAKAWFQDALNRDPANVGLKRLVALADDSLPASTVETHKQTPIASDLELLFPGLRAMKDRQAPSFKTLPDGRVVQLPQESDVDFLFFPRAQLPAPKRDSPK